MLVYGVSFFFYRFLCALLVTLNNYSQHVTAHVRIYHSHASHIKKSFSFSNLSISLAFNFLVSYSKIPSLKTLWRWFVFQKTTLFLWRWFAI